MEPKEDEYPADLVDLVASELLRFTRNEDEDEIARKIIREVFHRLRGLPLASPRTPSYLADIERLALELFDKDTDYDWSKVHQSLRDHYMHRAARLLDRSKQINDEIDAIEAALAFGW
jgi:hypothetical protein